MPWLLLSYRRALLGGAACAAPALFSPAVGAQTISQQKAWKARMESVGMQPIN